MGKTIRQRHLDGLKRRYGINVDMEHFFRVARRLECKLRRESAIYLSVKDAKKPDFDKALERLLPMVNKKKLFRSEFYGNDDARGYALKLENNDESLFRDLGGYRILAPEF